MGGTHENINSMRLYLWPKVFIDFWPILLRLRYSMESMDSTAIISDWRRDKAYTKKENNFSYLLPADEGGVETKGRVS